MTNGTLIVPAGRCSPIARTDIAIVPVFVLRFMESVALWQRSDASLRRQDTCGTKA
jgi:hypothetical protein